MDGAGLASLKYSPDLASVSVRVREREREIYFKELAHGMVGAGTAEISRTGHKAGNSGRMSLLPSEQNSFFRKPQALL